jgi:agmatinase
MSKHDDGDQAFRAASLYGRQPEMTYGGAPSFLRRRYTRDVAGADVVVSGLPFDAATTYRPGARFGPAAIRAASAQLAELDAFPWGFDPFDHLAVADYGDCFLDAGYPGATAGQIAAHARTILQQGPGMLTFGGDHFVTYPLLQAHAEVHGPLALLQFDAHPDTWTDDGQRLDHGTMVTRAVEQGLVSTAHSVQAGIRTQAPDAGFTVLDAPWAWIHGDPGPRRRRDAGAHPRRHGRAAGLHLVRHRLPGPRVRARHGDPGGGRAEQRPGAGDPARAERSRSCRHGCGGGRTGLRPRRHHRPRRGHAGA